MNFFAIFIGIFLPGSSMDRIRGKNFLSRFLGLSPPVLAKNNAVERFFNFLNFFAIFFGIILPGSSRNGIRDLNIFQTFSDSINLFWIAIMLELTFLIFWILLLFFMNFPARIECEWDSGLNFFFSFSAYLIPFWLKILSERDFLIFLNFFAIFFRIILPGSSRNGIRNWNIFQTFSDSLNSFWRAIMPELTFLIFWIFLLFF